MIGLTIFFIGGIAAFHFFPFFPVSIILVCIAAIVLLFLIQPNLFFPHSGGFADEKVNPVRERRPLTVYADGGFKPLSASRGDDHRLKSGAFSNRVKLNRLDSRGRSGDFWKKILSIVLIFVSGFIYSYVRQETVPEIRLPDRDVFIEGTVIDVPESSKGKIRFTIDDINIEGEDIQGRARLFILLERFFEKGTSNYFVFNPGDRISAVARLWEPGVFHNPGVYSYDLKKDGIVATGYIKQMKTTGRGRGILEWMHKERQRLGRIIDNSLSSDNASLHKAILPGLKRGISQDMRDSFSSTGLAHLLSISGTHFGLLAFIIFKFIKTVIKFLPIRFLTRMTLYITPSQVAVILTLPVLILYALISGTSTPTIRSFIMIFIFMLALFLGRKGQWLNSLSIAAIIILLWRPDALFELSFILSFIAVLSIGYVLEKKTELENLNKELELEYITKTAELSGTGYKLICRNFMQKSFDRIKTGLIITIAAVLGTAPIVALYFKQFPLISPITNLIVTPLVCFVILPLGFFTGFSALLFNMSSMPLNGLTDAITHFALNLIKSFSNIPYSNLHVPNPLFVIIVLYFLSLMFIIKSKVKWRFLPLVFVICFYLVSPYLSNDNFRITFLDVGQGDSSVVELPDGRVMLIDGGSDRFDAGRRIIAPYLWSKGIRKIDFMVLSHPHPDHYGGLIYIMDNFKIGEIWLNGRLVQSSAVGIDSYRKTRSWMLPGAGEFFQKMQEEKIPGKILRRGDVLEAEKYRIYVLHPYDEFYADSVRGETSSENSDSLVLKIDTGDFSALFTGDIGAEAEENLIHLGKWLKSDIIKVPHHGGRTSSSEEFLKAVNPEIAVVSAGKNNSFGHPHGETVERYNEAGIKLLRTDMDGAVTVTSTGSLYDIKTYWDSKFKKVNSLKDEIRNLRLLLRII